MNFIFKTVSFSYWHNISKIILAESNRNQHKDTQTENRQASMNLSFFFLSILSVCLLTTLLG